jgi:hypothetical protein
MSIDVTIFLQRLVIRGWHLQAVPVEGGWLEIDSLNDLEGFRLFYRTGELDRFIELLRLTDCVVWFTARPGWMCCLG